MTYDITLGSPLVYGYKYDSKTNFIQFTGFEPTSEENAVYLVFHNGKDYLIPLTTDFKVEIGSPLTDTCGEAEGQLVEISTDGTYVRNSNTFPIFVKRSLERGTETEVTSPALELIYNQMYELYVEIRDHVVTEAYVREQVAPLKDSIDVLKDAVEVLQRHMTEAETNIEDINSRMLSEDDVNTLIQTAINNADILMFDAVQGG
jgi:hypothetical protein